MKPFDPNCKPGAELLYESGHECLFFVGFMRNGSVAFERSNGELRCAYPEKLSMAPRKMVKYMAVDNLHGGVTQWHDSIEKAQECKFCKGRQIATITWEE